MRALVIDRPRGPVELRELPDPIPPPGLSKSFRTKQRLTWLDRRLVRRIEQIDQTFLRTLGTSL